MNHLQMMINLNSDPFGLQGLDYLKLEENLYHAMMRNTLRLIALKNMS